jgi:hypothetical protein
MLSEGLSTATRRLHAIDASTPGDTEIPGDGCEFGTEELSLGNHDEIDTRPGLRGTKLPEHLSNQAFGPITIDRAAEFAGGDDPETRGGEPIREHQKREQPAMYADSTIEHGAEFAAASNPALFWERGRGRRDRVRIALSSVEGCRRTPRSLQEPPRSGPKTMKRSGACALLRGVV